MTTVDTVALRVVEAAVLAKVDVAVVGGPAGVELAACQDVEVVVDTRVEASQDGNGVLSLTGGRGDVCLPCFVR